MAHSLVALANVKIALSPIPTLLFRPQIENLLLGIVLHAFPRTSPIATHAINVV